MRFTWILCLLLVPLVSFAEVTWTRSTIDHDFPDAQGLYLPDIDQDGYQDILGASAGGDVVWWKNFGNSVFSTGLYIETNAQGAQSVFSMDHNGSHNWDILATLSNPDAVVWFENDGSENFTALLVGDDLAYPTDAVAADFDGNGWFDVVATGGGDGIVRLYSRSAPGGYTPIDLYNGNPDADPRDIAIDDIDLDGDTDIAVAFAGVSSLSSVAWFENLGNNQFEMHTIDAALPGACSVDIGDIDDDNDIDIAAASSLLNEVRWYSHVGPYVFYANTLDDELDGAAFVAVEDMDGDSHVDLVALGLNELYFYKNNGMQNFDRRIVSDIVDGGSGMVVGRMNTGYQVDIVAASADYNDIYYWEQVTVPYRLELESPDGGEVWYRGETYTITWFSIDPSDFEIRIELIDLYDPVLTIVESTPNDGAYTWQIPDDVPVGFDYRIRVSLVNHTAYDLSDGVIRIVDEVNFTIDPVNPPIVIPADGGTFEYTVYLHNTNDFPIAGVFQTSVEVPFGGTISGLRTNHFTIAAHGTIAPAEPLTQHVPRLAPPGEYLYIGTVGRNQFNVAATASFPVTKLMGEGNPLNSHSGTHADWAATDNIEFVAVTDSPGGQEVMPTGYTLASVYPNPFNGSATVSVGLPAAGDLTLAVYNVAGRQVMTLHDGAIPAGMYEFSLDLSNAASGLYFVRASVPGQWNATSKALLLR